MDPNIGNFQPVALYFLAMDRYYEIEKIISRGGLLFSFDEDRDKVIFLEMMQTLLRLSYFDDTQKFAADELGNETKKRILEARNLLGMVFRHMEDYETAYLWYALAGEKIPEEMLAKMGPKSEMEAKQRINGWKPRQLRISPLGSGFHMGEGFILTNNHVVNKPDQMR